MLETTGWARRVCGGGASCALIVAWSLPGEGPSPQSALAPPSRQTAAPMRFAATSCPRIVSRGVRNPVNNGYNATKSRITVANYRLVGCWVSLLAARSFVYDEYASAQGAGLAVSYGGTLVALADAGGAPPVVVRFTGVSACWSEQADAYYFEVNLQTGRVRLDPQVQRSCAPPQLPARYVLGLSGRWYPVGIELRT